MRMAAGVRKGPKKSLGGRLKKSIHVFWPHLVRLTEQETVSKAFLGPFHCTNKIFAGQMANAYFHLTRWQENQRKAKIPNKMSSHRSWQWQSKWKVRVPPDENWEWGAEARLKSSGMWHFYLLPMSCLYLLSMSKYACFDTDKTSSYKQVIGEWEFQHFQLGACLMCVFVFVLENDRSLEGGWVGNGRHCKIKIQTHVDKNRFNAQTALSQHCFGCKICGY